MGWLEVLTLLGLLSGLALTAETFRSEPMWLRADTARPGPSPRQRRWVGAGISLAMAGQLVGLPLEGDTWLWALSFALGGSGLVCALTGAIRGPTEAEHRRRAQMLQDDSGAA